jgi:hypothetical protein
LPSLDHRRKVKSASLVRNMAIQIGKDPSVNDPKRLTDRSTINKMASPCDPPDKASPGDGVGAADRRRPKRRGDQ